MRATAPRLLSVVLLSLLTLPAFPKTSAKYVSGQLLVRFRSATSAAVMQESHQRYGGKVKKQFQKIKNLQLIELAQGQRTEQVLAQYRSDPNVLYAELNYVRRATGVPNDPNFANQWALNNT